MAMTKKEKEALDAALTAAALRTTADVSADVPPPKSKGLTKGWLPVAERSDFPRVEPACSSSDYHGKGQQYKTTSQGARRLYSTKILALKALRREVEKDCAERLRRVDRMIEEESSNSEVSGAGTASA